MPAILVLKRLRLGELRFEASQGKYSRDLPHLQNNQSKMD
jgi:hypothetical protein